MVCVNVPLGTKEKRATLVSATLLLVIVLILSACLCLSASFWTVSYFFFPVSICRHYYLLYTLPFHQSNNVFCNIVFLTVNIEEL